jgi:PhzF family phenazine biosynthesis protein
MQRGFLEIDVFGAAPFRGNPLAVVLDGSGLSTEEMQDFANWTNFSETTFLLPPSHPEADYRVRIFTTAHELPFAGHPTLGSCHAWLSAGGGRPRTFGRILQECGAGLVPVRQRAGQLAFAAPPLWRGGPVAEDLLVQLATVLGIPRSEIIDSQWVDNGPGWVGVMLHDAAAVLALKPDFSRWAGGGRLDLGVIGAYPQGSDCAFEVRALFSGPGGTMIEDPVTGSLNASFAAWLLSCGRAKAPFRTSQGTCLGRRGRPEIDQDPDGTIWVGGSAVTCVRGEVAL